MGKLLISITVNGKVTNGKGSILIRIIYTYIKFNVSSSTIYQFVCGYKFSFYDK